MEILAHDYHFTLHYCLYRLSLDHLLNYAACRTARLRREAGPPAEDPTELKNPTPEALESLLAGLG